MGVVVVVAAVDIERSNTLLQLALYGYFVSNYFQFTISHSFGNVALCSS